MNVVTDISRYKAKLNGRTVRLRPVTTKSIRGGKFYIRFFSNYAELVKVVGGSFGMHDANLRSKYPDLYFGKTKIGIMHGLPYRLDDEYYLSDLGCYDKKHWNGAVLFEFTNLAWELLNSLTKQQADDIMEHYPNFWDDGYKY